MYDVSDTIAALATVRDGAIRGIVRISGPGTIDCLARIFQATENVELRAVRLPRVVPGMIRVAPPIGDVPGDVYLWPTRRSYTRQPCAELHTLGSPPVLDAVLAAACAAGTRLALPGEFTLRAFLAGRLDLTQAEAVLGVIDARGGKELEAALHQLAGGLTRPLQSLRNQLLDLLAHVEAGLDFVEEDIEFITSAHLDSQLAQAHDAIADLLHRMSHRLETAGQPTVVFRGYPNVGKSSLFNALAGRPAAIVSPMAGTTRDYVTQVAELGGRKVLLVDTAGMESFSPTSSLEVAAQDVAARQAEQASLQILCLDSSRPMNVWEREELSREPLVPRLVVLTKVELRRQCDYSGKAIATSSRQGLGLIELRTELLQGLELVERSDRDVVTNTAVRCRESLRRAAESLHRARTVAAARQGEELVAAELRSALDDLGTVVGAVYTDDLLDRIFSRFCIGK